MGAQAIGHVYNFVAVAQLSFFHWVATTLGIFPDEGLGSFLGGVFSALYTTAVAGAVALYLQRIIPRRIKASESAVAFSKRFQELLQAQHELDAKFYYDETGRHRGGDLNVTDLDRANAWNLYRQYFDLLLQEFVFFEQGFIETNVFTEWMKWRWLAWAPDRNPPAVDVVVPIVFEICGVPYRTGWEWYVKRPVVGSSSFVRFLSAIHEKPTGEMDVGNWVRRWSRRQHKFV